MSFFFPLTKPSLRVSLRPVVGPYRSPEADMARWCAILLLFLSCTAAAQQAPICDNTCEPDPGSSTYSGIAGRLDHPNASRAVGSAVGANPVAFIIPCHRVIRSTGETGQYHWGSTRKSAMLGWEASKVLKAVNQI